MGCQHPNPHIVQESTVFATSCLYGKGQHFCLFVKEMQNLCKCDNFLSTLPWDKQETSMWYKIFSWSFSMTSQSITKFLLFKITNPFKNSCILQCAGIELTIEGDTLNLFVLWNSISSLRTPAWTQMTNVWSLSKWGNQNQSVH